VGRSVEYWERQEIGGRSGAAKAKERSKSSHLFGTGSAVPRFRFSQAVLCKTQ
jgi:hypothetical protein